VSKSVRLHVGLKTDPIQYRFSYDWLFRLLAEEGVHRVQLGTFCEIYHLPDDWFVDLRCRAEHYGLTIASVFTAHRELGGFYRPDARWQSVARRNYERLIEVGALVGASSVGSSPGAVMRDEMGTKALGTATYLGHAKELMHYAHERGVARLTIEPMSCMAEPPTLPDEIAGMAEELHRYHQANTGSTADIGYCVDVSHGYADRDRQVVHDNMALLAAALPYTTEVHLKNTDAVFESTFGFSEEERERGIVDIAAVRDLLIRHADRLPVADIIGYLEIGGPKTGRDYSDQCLEEALRASLRHVKEAFLDGGAARLADVPRTPGEVASESAAAGKVLLAPSVMCEDLCHLEDGVRRLERIGADWLHFDVADAHFVPNILLGLDVVRQLRPKTAMPFDVHLMVEDPSPFLEVLADIGVEFVSVHVEPLPHLDRVLARIHELGMKAGAALNPSTPVDALRYVVDRLDFAVLMTVNPGFAGQRLVPSALRKVADCRAFLSAHGRDIPIEVDGNVSFENIPQMVAAGGGILVCGTSSLYHRHGSLAENARRTRDAVAQGLALRAAP